MQRLRFLVGLLAVGVLGSPGVRAADLVPLNLVVIPADSAGQAYYALDQGFFKANGLDVHITAMSGSPPIIAAVASGSVDVGNSVVGSAAAARTRGINVRFIAAGGLWTATAPTAKLVVLKDSPLHAAADFSGKTIAVTGLADLTYFATRAWLDQNGTPSSAAKFVELTESEMLPALQQHRIDAAFLLEPFLAGAADQVTAVAAVDDNVAKRFMATGWIASDTWIAAHPDLAARFATAMRQTADWANTHHKESADILLRYTKLTPDIESKMVRVTYGAALDPALIQPVIENAMKYGTFPNPVTAADLIWTPGK